MQFSRPIGGTQTGFGSVVNRFPPTHDQRNFSTTSGDFFGKPQQESAQKVIENFNKTYNKQAGGHVRPFEQ